MGMTKSPSSRPKGVRPSATSLSLASPNSLVWRYGGVLAWLSAGLLVLQQLATVEADYIRLSEASLAAPAPTEPRSAPPTEPAQRTAGLEDYLQIRVTSSAHLLLVIVNSQVIVNVTTTLANVSTSDVKYTDWELTSGMYVLVFHPHDGRLMLRRNIPTAIFGEAYEVPSVLKSLTPGHLVVLAIKNDAAQNLTPTCRRLLHQMGVKSAGTLDKRESLAWVATLGTRVWGEVRTLDVEEELGMVWAAGVTIEVLVPRALEDTSCFAFEDDPREAARAHFCQLYDGYGDLCVCPDLAPLSYPALQLENSAILDVPLVVLAGNRPTYLYRSLVTLLRQAGGSPDRMLVVVDGSHPQVSSLLSLLQVPHEEHKAQGVSVGARISDHYRHALSRALARFPHASKVIMLEEDLLVAPDFFSYFNQTGWLLGADPSLCCVSAWSDLGSLHVAHDPRLLRRLEVLPGLGWMVARHTIRELLARWPSSDTDHDWDMWVRQVRVLAGRECVVPDVTRTFHIGLSGSHVAGLLHTAFFALKPVPLAPSIPLLGVDRMTEMEYEEDLYRLLEGDLFFLHSSVHPCHPGYLPRNVTDRPVVLFVEMNSGNDHYAWQILARCLGLWDLDARGHHRGLFRFYFYDTEVLVIGYPFSDYSFVRPPRTSVLRVNTTQELKLLDLMPLTHRARFRRPQLERLAPYLDVPYPVF